MAAYMPASFHSRDFHSGSFDDLHVHDGGRSDFTTGAPRRVRIRGMSDRESQASKPASKPTNSSSTAATARKARSKRASAGTNVTVSFSGPSDQVGAMLTMSRDTRPVRIRGINAPGDKKKRFKLTLDEASKTKWHQAQSEYWNSLATGIETPAAQSYEGYRAMKNQADQKLGAVKLLLYKENVAAKYTSLTKEKPSPSAKKAQSVLNKMQKRLDKTLKPRTAPEGDAWQQLKSILTTFYDAMALNWNSESTVTSKEFKAKRQAAFAEKRTKMISWRKMYTGSEYSEDDLKNHNGVPFVPSARINAAAPLRSP